MARYIDYNYDQMKMIPVAFSQQIVTGSFEHSLSWLIDNELDLSLFEFHYKNDLNGRPAYDPALLLKIVIFAYSRGITSSRRIEQLCRENIIFMALSADTRPHFTTISDFISRSPDAISELFTQIVLMCDHLGLIGKEMFAIDGCKLPSNAAKEWSGTHEELKKKHKKIDRAVQRMLDKHKRIDNQEKNSAIIERETKQIKKLKAASSKIKGFLAENEIRKGRSGNEVKSNLTDNESAKMKTSNGVIQGYVGVAAVDSKHQVVIDAKAYGQGQEHDLLEPMIEGVKAIFAKAPASSQAAINNAKITADSGYHNRKSVEYIEEEGIDAYLADTGFRSRDPRFKDYEEHKPKARLKPRERFTQEDFTLDIKAKSCRCPAGHMLWLKAEKAKIDRSYFMQFQGYEKTCGDCSLRKRCLRKASQTTPRQINVKLCRTEESKDDALERMRQKIDSEQGRHIYSQRLGTVEPVFGHITDAIGIKRFTLRGRKKVDGQWKLMMALHNLLKIHRYGWCWE